MEVVKLVDDTTKRQYAGHIHSQMSASGPNAESIPSKAFHFGLLDVPLLEVFPSPTDAGESSELAPSRSSLTAEIYFCQGLQVFKMGLSDCIKGLLVSF